MLSKTGAESSMTPSQAAPEVHEPKITLVGAGLVGSLLSLYLSRRGFQVEIFESRADMRRETISAGRSINLALSTRGIHALHDVGLEREVLALAIPMRGRMVHSMKGELNFQRYGRDDSEYINSVSRSDLNKLLMNEAEKTGRVKINFNKKVKTVDLQNKNLTFENGERRPYQVLIGTDGSASAVRHALATESGAGSSEEYLDYGYKELLIPAGVRGGFQLDKGALHIWPRGTYMLIALPNLDGSFTATLFLPDFGSVSFEKLTTADDVFNLFRENFADVLPLFPQLADEFFKHPVGRMVTVKTLPWSHRGEVLILGDAAHAIVPFFGQGMNCGFEDCTVFNEILNCTLPRSIDGGVQVDAGTLADLQDMREDPQSTPINWESIFTEFSSKRKKDADAIADLAVENFIEMRDKVAQKQFILEKNVERLLLEKFPDHYVTRYQLVTFTRTPYSMAAQIGRIQNEILAQLCANLNGPEDVDLSLAENLIKKELSPAISHLRERLDLW